MSIMYVTFDPNNLNQFLPPSNAIRKSKSTIFPHIESLKEETKHTNLALHVCECDRMRETLIGSEQKRCSQSVVQYVNQLYSTL